MLQSVWWSPRVGHDLATGVRLRSRPTMANKEGLQSRRASHRPLECNCERAKTKVPYKVPEI